MWSQRSVDRTTSTPSRSSVVSRSWSGPDFGAPTWSQASSWTPYSALWDADAVEAVATSATSAAAITSRALTVPGVGVKHQILKRALTRRQPGARLSNPVAPDVRAGVARHPHGPEAGCRRDRAGTGAERCGDSVRPRIEARDRVSLLVRDPDRSVVGSRALREGSGKIEARHGSIRFRIDPDDGVLRAHPERPAVARDAIGRTVADVDPRYLVRAEVESGNGGRLAAEADPEAPVGDGEAGGHASQVERLHNPAADRVDSPQRAVVEAGHPDGSGSDRHAFRVRA